MAATIQTGCIKLSQQLLYAVKTGAATNELKNQLAQLTEDTLATELSNDTFKKAFWLNIYNAFVQESLQQNPEQYKNRRTFYRKKFIHIAGHYLSPDLAEHGILRHSRNKWSLGYAGKLFPSTFEKKHRVAAIDYRIHFALNCGAASCPPIAFYEPGRIDQQLDMATAAYLGSEAEYIAAKNKVLLPSLISWFRADFGGKAGIKKILIQHAVIPANAAERLKFSFKKYDWSLAPGSYKEL
jgi:Protein of unknown function, DUF547